MNTFYLRQRSRQLWASQYNQRQWVRSVLKLGDKWLLATPMGKTS